MLWCEGWSSSASVAAQTGVRVLTSSLPGAGGVRACWRGTETEGRAPGRALRARASADTRVHASIGGSIGRVRPSEGRRTAQNGPRFAAAVLDRGLMAGSRFRRR